MWTPKRILLLALGFAAFLGAYLVYAIFLGGIDGLPPLPGNYLPVAGPLLPGDDLPALVRETSAKSQLRLAFGEGCPELGYNNQLELQPRGMVIATNDFSVLDDGRVLLKPFSLAIIRKDRDPGGFPEVNTVQCKEAYLRFDKPITKIFDITNNRKIVGGELRDEITLINNRKTKPTDDDISLKTQGPLFYDESRQLIWTDKEVVLLDTQSKPEPVKISGIGMDIELAQDAKPVQGAQAAARGSRGGGPSGINRIHLRNVVEMSLWVDGQSGFLSSGKKATDGKSAATVPLAKVSVPVAAPSEKAKVLIRTRGPFVYDMRTDHATFEIAHNAGPNSITVDRYKPSEGKVDHLECDECLELQFKRKAQTGDQAPAPGETKGDGLDIETARAIGKEVVVSSEADMLEARGTDFTYHQLNPLTRLTTLKGNPRVYVVKEGTEIRAAELQILDQKGAQQATALGEGDISLFDKNKRSLEARWSKKLIYVKEGAQDVLTLIGDAVFKDPEHQQTLRAETFKVWLAPAEPTVKADADQQHRKPEKLDAVERVTADGPDLRIHDTDHLIVTFRDVPPTGGRLPAAFPTRAENAGAAPETKSKAMPGGGAALEGRPAATANGGVFSPGPSDPAKHKKPIDLSAKLVQTTVLRDGNKNDLESVTCEGAVRVVQEPATPGERGTDIRGEFLKMDHFADGNKLEVRGNLGQVQLNQICIIGPVVYIDQTANCAEVKGAGAMRLPSKNNLDGTPLAQETELVINWEKRMFFDGQKADFEGRVKATQDQGHLATQDMSVFLDRKISLRDGDKANPPARVRSLICQHGAWVEDSTFRAGQLVSYKRVEGTLLAADVDPEGNDSIVDVDGPGRVRLFQLGNKSEMFPGQKPAPNAPGVPTSRPQGKAKEETKDEEFKLTQVTFQGKMKANNKQGIAKFWENVVVVHVPTNDRDLRINELEPPPESMRLSCKRLEVLSRKLPDGTVQQEMKAEGRVLIIGQDFEGSAETVKHDESKGLLVLEGTEGNLAELVRQPSKGARRDSIRAVKIMYWPKTGLYDVDRTTSINGSK